MPGKVLIIEDDPDTARLVGLYLSRDGYRVHSPRRTGRMACSWPGKRSPT